MSTLTQPLEVSQSSSEFKPSDLRLCRIIRAESLIVGGKIIRVYFNNTTLRVHFDVYTIVSEVFQRYVNDNKKLPALALDSDFGVNDFFVCDLGIEPTLSKSVWLFSYSDELHKYIDDNKFNKTLVEQLRSL